MEERKIRLIKNGVKIDVPCANITPDAVQRYLVERRRALLTELEALNRALNMGAQKTK